MNARQKVKKYKKKISALESDNDLMREIITDNPAMQELYDLYNKPKFVTHTTMRFQEYQSKAFLSPDDPYDAAIITIAKRQLEKKLIKVVKENITYEIDNKDIAPIITASIFIGNKPKMIQDGWE